jgi:outer membrane protein
VIPELSVGVYRPIGEKWMLFGAVKYEFLPNELTDSPLLDRDASGSAGLRIGFSRGF